MRELHVLGVSEDGATLLLGTSKNATKPTHRVPVDERLRTAARGQLAPFGTDRAESELSPKEMQARLREGATVEEVAKAAGVPVARVLPYFVPVEAERTRIVDEARGGLMHRNRGPVASTPLGQAVDTRLQDVTGIKPESITWTARRRRDGAWVVGVSYVARGRRKAEWLWQPVSREVSPLDPAAARLGGDAVAAPAKRRVAAAPKPKPAKAKAKAKPTPKPKPKATKAAAKKVAKPAAKRPAAAKPAPAKKAVTAKKAVPTPKRAVAAKKTAATPVRTKVAAAAKPTPAPKTTPKPVPTRAAKPKVTKPRRPRVVPAPEPQDDGPYFEPAVIQLPVAVPVPAPVEEPAAAAVEQEAPAPAAVGRKPGQRVPVPSWSDVLIGVTGQRDEGRRSG